MGNPDEVEYQWISGVILRWKWLVVGCALLGILVAIAVIAWMPSKFEATVTLLVQPAPASETSEYASLVAGEQLAYTYSQMLKERPVLMAAIAKLGLQETPDSLAERLTTIPIKGTQLIKLIATADTSDQATLLANTIAEAFTEHIQTLQEERYTGTLTNIQEKITVLAAQIETTLSEIDTLNMKRIEGESDLTRLENLLVESRSDYRLLLESYQSLQLTVDTETNQVNIVDPAHVEADRVQPFYTATVILLIDPSLITGGAVNAIASPASNHLAQTYGQMLVRDRVLAAAIAQTGLAIEPSELAKRTSVDLYPDTQLLLLRVQDTHSETAEALANAVAEVFVRQIRDQLTQPYLSRLESIQTQMTDATLEMEAIQAEIKALAAENAQIQAELDRRENTLVETRDDYRGIQQEYERVRLTSIEAADAVVIAEQASVPEQSNQHRWLYTIVAALLGGLVGLGAAFLLDQLNNTIKTPEGIHQALNLNLLGSIGQVPNGAEGIVLVSQPASPAAEDFRRLGTNLRLSNLSNPIRTLLVTSPSTMEGKSVVAANLAVAMAVAGMRVVAVDADLRLPRLHNLFHLDPEEGLIGSLLRGSVDGNLQPTPIDRLKVIPSGGTSPSPVEALCSPQMVHILEELKQRADLVIIDCPPVLSVTDSLILASMVDGVLLVLRAGRTNRQSAREAVKNLHQVKATLIGAVLNAAPKRKDDAYRYRAQRNKPGKTKTGLVRRFKRGG